MHALLDRALAAARQLRASDVHLKAGLAPVLRIDGDLRTLSDVPPLSREFLQSLAFSMLNDRRREILDRTGDVALSLVAPDGSRQRVQVSQHRGGTTIAVRLVPAQAPTLEKLGLPPEIGALVEPGAGLVLVAGPAGAGKTTTLAALANQINGARACHIVSIEDPVEIALGDRRSVVVQREVGLDAPSAAAALRAALRQDVDVLVVGEPRDEEAIDLAVHAAETGRLVLAGVGAADVGAAAERWVELAGAERPSLRGRLARALRGVVAQRLVKRPDGRGRGAAVDLLLVDDGVRSHLTSTAPWLSDAPALREAVVHVAPQPDARAAGRGRTSEPEQDSVEDEAHPD
ncbi:MAG TPA: ATPase, T2SS/T4P/T4SS family [Polyangia bacterium]|nr:ATPase, T2SS/T4P/T4SS family [Polyangia bacterium]